MNHLKFSLGLRLEAVHYDLSGKGDFREVAAKFGIGRTTLRRWVTAYQIHGIDGLSQNSGTFPPEFRLRVVTTVINDKLSLREATAKFNLSGESTVWQWLKRYQSGGADALIGCRHGRPKKVDKNIHPKPDTANIQPELLTEEQKLEEIRFLRAQVDYLKKLQALAQEEATDRKRG